MAEVGAVGVGLVLGTPFLLLKEGREEPSLEGKREAAVGGLEVEEEGGVGLTFFLASVMIHRRKERERERERVTGDQLGARQESETKKVRQTCGLLGLPLLLSFLLLCSSRLFLHRGGRGRS